MHDQKQEEKDNFWDIEKLIPKKKEINNTSRKNPRLAEIHLDSAEGSSSESVLTALPIPEKMPSYCYQNLSSLIRNVEVIDWKNSYHYYEFFCKNAVYFLDKHAEKCDRVSFFSYVPQYSQMSKAQLSWYLWWRENFHKGIFLDTDVSYILLYFYEVINLGDRLEAKISLERMIDVWSHYREHYPQLDSLVAEWVCDYSLIHKLPIPFPHEKINREMIGHSSLREAYYTFDPHDFVLYAKFLLTYCNAYNYRKSKFYNSETALLYNKHTVGTLAKLLREKREFFLDGHCHLHKVSRTAFTGALCSYRMRKRIEVEYISLSDTDELKDIITSIIKYSENKIRSYLSIRSRLGVKTIEREMIQVIDEYFAENHMASYSDVPDYERLYDIQDKTFSFDKAIEIERSSWNITEQLVESFSENTVLEETEIDAALPILSNQDDSPMARFEKEIAGYSAFFQCVMAGDYNGQQAYCKENGLLAEAVVDVINEKAVEIFEDILIEETESGFCIIEDYKAMFE